MSNRSLCETFPGWVFNVFLEHPGFIQDPDQGLITSLVSFFFISIWGRGLVCPYGAAEPCEEGAGGMALWWGMPQVSLPRAGGGRAYHLLAVAYLTAISCLPPAPGVW